MVTERLPRPVIAAHPIPALTGLRAIAAYAVFLHHYNPSPAGTFAYRLFAQGYVGVTIFFVLSGFLIHYRYADPVLTGRAWSWRTYLRNRFARLFPLYALVLLATVGINVLMGRTMNWPLFGLNLTLLNGFFDDYKFSGIAQSWSLTVEACFYVLAPLLFIGLRRWGALLLTVSLTGWGLLIWATASWTNEPAGATGGFFGNLPFVLFYTFFGRSFEFVLGMALARRWQQGRLPALRFATASGLVLMGCCIGWQACLPTLTTSADRLFWSEVAVYNYLLPLGIALFFAGLLREKTMLRSLLAQPIMQAGGRGSYAFYLIHVGVLSKMLQKTGLISSNWVLPGVLVLIAHGLYVWVERPAQAYFRDSTPRQRPTVPTRP